MGEHPRWEWENRGKTYKAANWTCRHTHDYHMSRGRPSESQQCKVPLYRAYFGELPSNSKNENSLTTCRSSWERTD